MDRRRRLLLWKREAVPGGATEEAALAFYPVSDMWIPKIPPFSPQTAFATSVIDATGEKFAWIGRMWNSARADKSIRKVGFRFGTVTKAGGSGLTVSLQNVDTANGPPFQPDGTQDQTVAIANGDAGFASNLWYTTGNFSADRAVEFGELVAVVIEYDGSGRLSSDAVNLTNITASVSNQGVSGCSLLTASWAAVSVVPNIILEFSDGTFGTLEGAYPASAQNGTAAFNTGTTPDERAQEFSFPASVKVDGAWLHIFPVAGGDFDVVLYDGTTPVATVSIDINTVRAVAAGQLVLVTFDEVTLTKDTIYRLAVKPTTANNVSIFDFSVAAAGHKNAVVGTNWNTTSRTDAGAWGAAVATQQFYAGLRISAIQG